ncbi:unnamed protein product [Musa acuminata var. zebrina]
MPAKNVVSWSAMITAYAQGDCPFEALSLFEEMWRLDVTPKCAAVVIFDALVPKDVFSGTAMIGGLAINGHGAEALELFGQMERDAVKPNEVTFSLVSCALAAMVVWWSKQGSALIQ